MQFPFLSRQTVKGLISIHQVALMDSCVPLVYQPTGEMDIYNQPIADYVEGADLACKFRYLSSREIAASAVNAVAELRLKPTDSLDPKQRIRMVHLFGNPFPAPNLFEVISGGLLDYVANVYQLSLVNDGTE